MENLGVFETENVADQSNGHLEHGVEVIQRQRSLTELGHGRLRIGALPDNEIVVSHKEASRYHAELRVTGKRVHIWDLQSLNKTWVNGKAVSSVELNANDVIRIADVEMRYES